MVDADKQDRLVRMQSYTLAIAAALFLPTLLIGKLAAPFIFSNRNHEGLFLLILVFCYFLTALILYRWESKCRTKKCGK